MLFSHCLKGFLHSFLLYRSTADYSFFGIFISESNFILPSFFKGIFSGHRIIGWKGFFFPLGVHCRLVSHGLQEIFHSYFCSSPHKVSFFIICLVGFSLYHWFYAIDYDGSRCALLLFLFFLFLLLWGSLYFLFVDLEYSSCFKKLGTLFPQYFFLFFPLFGGFQLHVY